MRLYTHPLAAAHVKQLVPLRQGSQAAALAQQGVDVSHAAGGCRLQLDAVRPQRIVPALQLLIPEQSGPGGWG